VKPGLTCISAGEARQRLAAWDHRLALEPLDLAQATGRVLGEQVLAREPLPPFPRAAMDGFAVRASDIAAADAGAPVVLWVVGRVVMGEPSEVPVGEGEAVAVSTGAHLPAGADTVVMLEETSSDGEDRVNVLRAGGVGRHIIPIGEEFEAGSLVLAPGRWIGAAEVAALAAFGLARVAVFRRARVAILSSGSELTPVEEKPAGAKIRDVNQHALAAAAEAAGAVVNRAGIAPEDPDLLAPLLAGLVTTSDLVIVSGGSSVGPRDLTAEAIARIGAELLFHGIEVRPGRPTLAARLDHTLIFGLPGVPGAALTIFQVFVERVLRALQGEAKDSRPAARVTARLATSVTSRAGREDYLRVQLLNRDGQTWARVLPNPSSLASIVGSGGLVIVPEEAQALDSGCSVEVLLV
jgi:molybdopterin molybdotransferase